MLDKPIRSVMQRSKALTAPPHTPVRKAAELMARRNTGAVMVVDNERLVGIVTERDVVFRVVARGLDVEKTVLADVMTCEPQTIDPGKPLGSALLVMHQKGFRHLPVIENGKPIGIVSSRSALDPELEEFVAEAQRRVYFSENT